METPELAVLNWQLINFQSGSKWPWHDSILPAGRTLRSDAMYVQPWARLSWRAWAAGSAPWGEIWEDRWMGRKAHGAASLLHAWDRCSWSTFGAKKRCRVILWTPRLPTSLALVIAQVAVSAKDAFDALFAATSAALIARLSTDPPASELYRACGFIIQYLLHDWVKSQNVEYGVAPTRQQLVRQACSLFRTAF